MLGGSQNYHSYKISSYSTSFLLSNVLGIKHGLFSKGLWLSTWDNIIQNKKQVVFQEMKWSVKDNGGGVREPELGPGGWVRLDTRKGRGEILQARETGLHRLGRRIELVSHSKEKSRVVGERLTRQGRISLWKLWMTSWRPFPVDGEKEGSVLDSGAQKLNSSAKSNLLSTV